MNAGHVYNVIQIERLYQDAVWGTVEANPHTVEEWLKIMGEELGEAFMALKVRDDPAAAMQEISQVVAVGFAAMEQHGVQPRAGLPDSERLKAFLASIEQRTE